MLIEKLCLSKHGYDIPEHITISDIIQCKPYRKFTDEERKIYNKLNDDMTIYILENDVIIVNEAITPSMCSAVTTAGVYINYKNTSEVYERLTSEIYEEVNGELTYMYSKYIGFVKI